MSAQLERLGLNLLYILPERITGTATYARALIGALLELRPDLEIVAYVAPETAESLESEPWGRDITLHKSPVRSSNKPLRAVAELTWLPRRAGGDRVQLLHSLGTNGPILCPVPSVVTVHDLIFVHYPEVFPLPARLGMRLLTPLSTKRACRVIADSEATKQDLVQTWGIEASKIAVVHLAAGEQSPTKVADPEAVRQRFELEGERIVLTVSATFRHKNLDRLLAAFSRLAVDQRAVLVVVGPAGRDQRALEDKAVALGVADRVRFTGWVDDATLSSLYSIADVFVYPSLKEGFGIPLLDAMHHHVPVACSDSSSLPEVAGQAAEYFDPQDELAIASAIERLLRDRQRREELMTLGDQRCASFTWRATAERTLDVYESVLAEQLR